MNEMSFAPLSEGGTTQLAELNRHELRRKINKLPHSSRQDYLSRTKEIYKWKQLNYVKFSCSVLAMSYLPGSSPSKYFRLSRA